MSVEQLVECVPARGSQGCAELLAVMLEQEGICQRLLRLSTAEQTAMLERRMDLLGDTTREKGLLIERMDRLESIRRRMAAQLAREVGISPDASLTDLAKRLGGQDGEDLLSVRQRVAEVVARLQESNEGNLSLMRKSLDLVRDSIRHLRRATGDGETYTSTGQSLMSIQGNLAVDCHA